MIVERIINGAMAVTENKIIISLVLEIFPGILNDRFIFFPEGVRSMNNPTVLRPAIGYPEGEVRVKACKGPLKESVRENPF